MYLRVAKGFLFLCCLHISTSPISAKILGAFVLPHGGIALNPSHFETPSKWDKQHAWAIHRAAVEVGRHIRSLAPSLVFLSTPHGVSDLSRFSFYMNSHANGSASTDNCGCPPCCYDVDVKLDYAVTEGLVRNLSAIGFNVTGTTFFGEPGDPTGGPSTLKWGEVIPLVFIKELANMKVVVLSQPSRRYNQVVSMIPELKDLGSKLYDELEALPQTVVVLISGDMAHTHDSSGPYGFSPDAEPFDQNVGNWAATLHPSYLLEYAATFVDRALSCGYSGFVMLHGMLDRGHLSSWIPVMHANYHPSYYGMMVASFSRKEATADAENNVHNNLFPSSDVQQSGKSRMLETNRIEPVPQPPPMSARIG